MKKPELTVCCRFSEEGETAAEIIFCSFDLFLQRELGHKPQPELLTRR